MIAPWRSMVRATAATAVLASLAAGTAGAQTKAESDVWPEHAAPDDETALRARRQLPLTQDQIRDLARLLRQSQRATARGEGPTPAARVRRIVLASAADGDIPRISVRRGYTTVISVTDVTGAPWPIEEAVVQELFLPEGGGPAHSGHLLYLAPRAVFLRGNVALKLRDLAAPLVAAIEEGGDEADFRVDLRLGIPGPNVDPEALTRPESFHAGDPALLGALTGVPPAGALRLSVDGAPPGARAWRLGDELLLVTRAHLLSPGPRAAERGAGGRWAYRLPRTPIALISRDGNPARITFHEGLPGVSAGTEPALSGGTEGDSQ